MKILNKTRFVSLLLLLISLFGLTSILFTSLPIYAASTVNLGTADNFAVLGGSTVTNTGSSVITGDLGLHPGLSVTGFPPGLVNGTTHAGDAVALQAQTDLTTAYNSATEQSCDTDLTGQDLGGLTLTSGVYCFDSSAQLTGTLTLNAEGNSDSVFIFKIGSTLTTASDSSVSLINSSQDCKVFWQVGSSATLGTTTNFKGNILALTSITFNTGANLDGRALARNGAVTLDINNITKATCTNPTPTPMPTPTPTSTSTPTPAPTSTPTPTPTPTSNSASSTSTSSSSDSTSTNNVAPCIASEITTVPIILELKRMSPTSVFISWGPFAGLDNFNVRYGKTNGDWLYNTDVTGFTTTINALPENQAFWFQVAARNICAIGTYGESKFIGQTDVINSKVLGVKFPNTGIGPKKNIPLKLILLESILIVLFFSSLNLGKQNNSSKH